MTTQLPDQPTDMALDHVSLLGFALDMPSDASLRLDQPCDRRHGSLGGWRRDDTGEVAFTLLWRQYGYWDRDDRSGDDPTELQRAFVDQAIAGTRKDSRALTVLDRREARFADHDGELVDTSIQVRRRAGRTMLRRRQAMWTCAWSGRHVAFEVSALAEEDGRVPALFDQLVATVTCHERTDS